MVCSGILCFQKENKSKEIEKYLKDEKKLFLALAKEPVVIILGSADSGKTTLLRQLRLYKGGKFSQAELARYSEKIKRNVLKAISVVSDSVTGYESVSEFYDFLKNTPNGAMSDRVKNKIIEAAKDNALLDAIEANTVLPENSR